MSALLILVGRQGEKESKSVEVLAMTKTLWKMAALSFAAFALSCSTGAAPRWTYDAKGRPAQYKRYPRNIAVDYFTRWRRVAYDKVEQPLEDFLSEEQRALIGKNGQPDYRRRPFGSREGERVEEWVYFKKNRLVQFVGGHVVYEGEVTDMERTMITLGYPSYCQIGQAEPGVETWTFVYKRPFNLEREVFTFANGKLTFRQTMR